MLIYPVAGVYVLSTGLPIRLRHFWWLLSNLGGIIRVLSSAILLAKVSVRCIVSVLLLMANLQLDPTLNAATLSCCSRLVR